MSRSFEADLPLPSVLPHRRLARAEARHEDAVHHDLTRFADAREAALAKLASLRASVSVRSTKMDELAQQHDDDCSTKVGERHARHLNNVGRWIESRQQQSTLRLGIAGWSGYATRRTRRRRERRLIAVSATRRRTAHGARVLRAWHAAWQLRAARSDALTRVAHNATTRCVRCALELLRGHAVDTANAQRDERTLLTKSALQKEVHHLRHDFEVAIHLRLRERALKMHSWMAWVFAVEKAQTRRRAAQRAAVLGRRTVLRPAFWEWHTHGRTQHARRAALDRVEHVRVRSILAVALAVFSAHARAAHRARRTNAVSERAVRRTARALVARGFDAWVHACDNHYRIVCRIAEMARGRRGRAKRRAWRLWRARCAVRRSTVRTGTLLRLAAQRQRDWRYQALVRLSAAAGASRDGVERSAREAQRRVREARVIRSTLKRLQHRAIARGWGVWVVRAQRRTARRRAWRRAAAQYRRNAGKRSFAALRAATLAQRKRTAALHRVVLRRARQHRALAWAHLERQRADRRQAERAALISTAAIARWGLTGEQRGWDAWVGHVKQRRTLRVTLARAVHRMQISSAACCFGRWAGAAQARAIARHTLRRVDHSLEVRAVRRSFVGMRGIARAAAERSSARLEEQLRTALRAARGSAVGSGFAEWCHVVSSGVARREQTRAALLFRTRTLLRTALSAWMESSELRRCTRRTFEKVLLRRSSTALGKRLEMHRALSRLRAGMESDAHAARVRKNFAMRLQSRQFEFLRINMGWQAWTHHAAANARRRARAAKGAARHCRYALNVAFGGWYDICAEARTVRNAAAQAQAAKRHATVRAVAWSVRAGMRWQFQRLARQCETAAKAARMSAVCAPMLRRMHDDTERWGWDAWTGIVTERRRVASIAAKLVWRIRHVLEVSCFNTWHSRTLARVHARHSLRRIEKRWERARARRAFVRMSACVRMHHQSEQAHAMNAARHAIAQLMHGALSHGWRAWVAVAGRRERKLAIVASAQAHRRRVLLAPAMREWAAVMRKNARRCATLRVAVLSFALSASSAHSAVRGAFAALCAHARAANIDARRARLQVIALRSRDTINATRTLDRWAAHVEDVVALRTFYARVALRGRAARRRRVWKQWRAHSSARHRHRIGLDRASALLTKVVVRRAWGTIVRVLRAASQRAHERVIGATMLRRMQHGTLFHGWHAWVDVAHTKRRQRTVVSAIMARWKQAEISALWRTWQSYAAARANVRAAMHHFAATLVHRGLTRGFVALLRHARASSAAADGVRAERQRIMIRKLVSGTQGHGFRCWVEHVARKHARRAIARTSRAALQRKTLRAALAGWAAAAQRHAYRKCALRAAFFRVSATRAEATWRLRRAWGRLQLHAEACKLEGAQQLLQWRARTEARTASLGWGLGVWQTSVRARAMRTHAVARARAKRRRATCCAVLDAWVDACSEWRRQKREVRRVATRRARVCVARAWRALQAHVRTAQQQQHTRTVANGVLRHLLHSTLTRGWNSWVARATLQKRVRVVLARTAHRWTYAHARVVFAAWSERRSRRVHARAVLHRAFTKASIARLVHGFDHLKRAWVRDKSHSRAVAVERARVALKAWQSLAVKQRLRRWIARVAEKREARAARARARAQWRQCCTERIFRSWARAVRERALRTLALRATFFRVSTRHARTRVALRSAFNRLRLNGVACDVLHARDRLQTEILEKRALLAKLEAWYGWVERVRRRRRQRGLRARATHVARRRALGRAWRTVREGFFERTTHRRALLKISSTWTCAQKRNGWRTFIDGLKHIHRATHTRKLCAAALWRAKHAVVAMGWSGWTARVARRTRCRRIIAVTRVRLEGASLDALWRAWRRAVATPRALRAMARRFERVVARHARARLVGALKAYQYGTGETERALASERSAEVVRKLQNLKLLKGWRGWTRKVAAEKHRRYVKQRAAALVDHMALRHTLRCWVESHRSMRTNRRVLGALMHGAEKRIARGAWHCLAAHQARANDATRRAHIEARAIKTIANRAMSAGWRGWVGSVAAHKVLRARLRRALRWQDHLVLKKRFAAWEASCEWERTARRAVLKLAARQTHAGMGAALRALRAHARAVSARTRAVSAAATTRAEVFSLAKHKGIRHYFSAWRDESRGRIRQRRVRLRAYVRIHIQLTRRVLHAWHVATLTAHKQFAGLRHCVAIRTRAGVLSAMRRWQQRVTFIERSGNAARMLRRVFTHSAVGPSFRLWAQQSALYGQVIVQPHGKRAVVRRAGALSLSGVTSILRSRARRRGAERTLRVWVKHARALKYQKQCAVVAALGRNARTAGQRQLRRAFSRLHSVPVQNDESVHPRKWPASAVRCAKVVEEAFAPCSAQHSALALMLLCKTARGYERRVTLRRFTRWRARAALLALREDPAAARFDGPAPPFPHVSSVTPHHVNIVLALRKRMEESHHENGTDVGPYVS